MPSEYLKKRIAILASRAKGKDLTSSERIRLEVRLDSKARIYVDRRIIHQVLAESLEVPEPDVIVRLAAHEDSERILDDIVNILNGPG